MIDENISNINEHIGSVVYKYRTLRNMTQAELAEKTDTTAKFVSQLENGKTGIRIDTLIKYINALDITPNIIFDGLFNNSHTIDTTFENSLLELNNEQKDLIISFMNMIKNYEINHKKNI